mmetsp:Transcript_6724/g.18991  ORF Transcript_6724/g.18991 Transcript_6724/m.18991 type:complete len:225 (-) Transcript_6724:717-1391(-)
MDLPTPSLDSFASKCAKAQRDSTSPGSEATIALSACRVCSKRPRPQKHAAMAKRSSFSVLRRFPVRGAIGAAHLSTCRKFPKALPHSFTCEKTTAFPNSARGEELSSFRAASKRKSARLSSSSALGRSANWASARNPFAKKVSSPLMAPVFEVIRSAWSDSSFALAKIFSTSACSGAGGDVTRLTYSNTKRCMVANRSTGRRTALGVSSAASKTCMDSSTCWSK